MTAKTKEIWRPIRGFEGRYEVSDIGRVRSLDKTVEHRSGLSGTCTQFYPSKIINQLKHNGYMQVVLAMNGKTSSARVHRLVANAFIPNPNQLPQVNHIDGDKTNNDANNLEWVTAKQNVDHSVLNGLRPTKHRGHGIKLIDFDTDEQHTFISMRQASLWLGKSDLYIQVRLHDGYATDGRFHIERI